MKAEFLKIAGVKSEAEFYKKFPSEEAFMKKHGKAVKSLMAKKAQVGTMIPNIQTPTSNVTPVRVDEEFLYDASASRTGRKSYDETMEDMKTQAQIAAGQQQSGGGSGLMGVLSGLFGEGGLSDLISNSGIGGGQGGGGSEALSAISSKEGGKVKKAQDGYSHPYLQNYVDLFRNRGNIANQKDVAGIMSSMNVTPSDTLFVGSSGDYNMANTMADFELAKYLAKQVNPDAYNAGQRVPVTYKDRLNFNVEEKDVYNDKDGYTSIKKSKKKAQGGTATPAFDFDLGDPGPTGQGYYNADGSVDKAGTFMGNAKDLYTKAAPIIGDIVEISDMMKAQKEQLAQAKQSRMVAEIALDAAKSKPEKIERDYVRPEDVQNTGEEFFPIYGVGTNVLARNGGMFSDPGYVPLVNPNQQKSFKQGGVLGSNSYLVPKAQVGFLSPGLWSEYSKMQKGKKQIKEDPASFARLLAGDPTAAAMFMKHGGKTPRAQGGFDMSNISYGGGGAGGVGMQIGDAVGFNNDAGSQIGGKIGGTVGSAFGPIGSAVGSFIGSGIGDLLDRDDRRTRKENEKAERATKNLAFSTVAPQIQAGYASHVREGGSIPSNPTMLDTMAMGGDVKTLWGGKVETASYNPYAGGESIQFKGNSHDYRDPRTGETGIGVAYGKDSVANNEAVVEVENEPAQQLRDGGGTENLVVYGDLKIPEEYVSVIGDDRSKNMKFKNYVSNVLNKDEAKINKSMERAADKGLESDNTIWGQLERSTADVILNGSDMKLKNIAEKKNILADLQSALNDTFDEYGIKGNEFISKNNIVEDPERAMNNMAKSGIEIKPENEGKFTAWAKERGMSVAEAANKVMANTDEYSPGVVKMANFAKNARKFKKGENGIDVPKLQGGGAGNVSKDDFNKQIGGGDVPTTDKTVEELLEDNYVLDKSRGEGVYVKQIGDKVVAVKPSGKSLGYTPKGQSIDKGTGLAGGITMEQISELEKKNPWFGKFDLSKPKVKWKGKMVHADVLKFQQDYNKRIEGTDIKPITQLDGVLGQETFEASYIPGTEGKSPKEEVVKVKGETTTETTTTAVPQQRGIPFTGFPAPVRGERLDVTQLLPEYYAAATNQVQPVYAQTYQPALRVPYDISLQAAKNDVISQSRALQRNPALQNNPAALALAQAPTYEALNKINETEFIANQKMKDEVYSGNLDQLNKARLVNLGIYDKQQERQTEAAAKTRTQQIDILNSISSKYSQKKLENRLEQVYGNLYPTYRYDDNFRTQVQQSTMFNLPGGAVSGIPGLATPGFNPALQQIPGVIGRIQSILEAQQQFNQQQGPQIKRGAMNRAMQNFDPNDIYDYVDPNQNDGYMPIEEGLAKKGKTVKKKNYKNSNILRELRNR